MLGEMSPGVYRTPLSRAPAFLLLLSVSLLLLLDGAGTYPYPIGLLISLAAPLGWGALGTVRPNRSSRHVASVLTISAICCAVFLSYALRADSPPAGEVSGRGTVLYAREWGFAKAALVRSDAGVFVLRLRRESGIRNGDIVAFTGIAVPFSRAETAGDFDEYLYWRAKGAVCAVETASAEARGRSVGPAAWRDYLSERISGALPPMTAGYVLASWTGERDESITELHRSVGTSHLLAVSGFHVGIVFALCWFFLGRFSFRLYAISVAIWLYAVLTGASPSSLRAALMIQMMMAGRLVGRLGNSFNTVCAAGVLMLLANPWMFWNVGWRLSMLAVLALTSLAQTDLGWGTKASLTCPLVWLATSAQSAWTFGAVPLAGLFINFLSLPAFGVLFPLSWALSLPALLGLPGGAAAAGIAEFLFARWEALSRNVLFLFPQRVEFSIPLLVSCVAVLSYLFAIASGFPNRRAILAAGVNLTGLCLLLYGWR
jgi:competence protein ComEC